jgi:hypothetical protein
MDLGPSHTIAEQAAHGNAQRHPGNPLPGLWANGYLNALALFPGRPSFHLWVFGGLKCKAVGLEKGKIPSV